MQPKTEQSYIDSHIDVTPPPLPLMVSKVAPCLTPPPEHKTLSNLNLTTTTTTTAHILRQKKKEQNLTDAVILFALTVFKATYRKNNKKYLKHVGKETNATFFS